ncbi:hypothetical protein [Hyphomonas sp.]|uniref:hypothetical protein n=1 Tax=Hyphomonas sp. TaxID=87 RepID=UPI0032F0236D|tara:strand:+ start:461 stop:832 length:372 start_codon:yes stop_codon:yes gene_type:complete
MLFKMILDGSGEDERPIVRGLLKHLIIGFGCGLMVGAVGLFLVLQALGNMRLDMPIIFVAAMMLQFGPVGGLVGVGIYLSRITDRSRSDEDDNDDGPGGGRKVHVAGPAAPRAATVTLRPASA